MTRRERFLRTYSQADWFAHLMLSTCLLAAINYLDVLVHSIVRSMPVRTGDFVLTACYFGPPPPLCPRFFVLLALLLAAPNAFMRTAHNRLFASIGSASALSTYVIWWINSFHTFRNYEDFAGIQALVHPEVKQFAYLYYGTPLDLAIAISTAVCLVLLLDRLFTR